MPAAACLVSAARVWVTQLPPAVLRTAAASLLVGHLDSAVLPFHGTFCAAAPQAAAVVPPHCRRALLVLRLPACRLLRFLPATHAPAHRVATTACRLPPQVPACVLRSPRRAAAHRRGYLPFLLFCLQVTFYLLPRRLPRTSFGLLTAFHCSSGFALVHLLVTAAYNLAYQRLARLPAAHIPFYTRGLYWRLPPPIFTQPPFAVRPHLNGLPFYTAVIAAPL